MRRPKRRHHWLRRSIGVRPCCMTPVYLDHEARHRPDCPEWGEHPNPSWVLPDLSRDPWRGVKFAHG